MPMKNTERSAVASALREILDMVDGDVMQPSFSTVSDCSASLQQIEPNPCVRMSGADEHHKERHDSQNN